MVMVYLVSRGKKSGIVIEGIVYQGTKSVKQLQQLLYILLRVLKKKIHLISKTWNSEESKVIKIKMSSKFLSINFTS